MFNIMEYQINEPQTLTLTLTQTQTETKTRPECQNNRMIKFEKKL